MQKPPKVLDENSLLTTLIEDVKGSNPSLVDISTLTIVKRNGGIVPFMPSRIARAIEAAFRDTKKIDPSEPLSSALMQTIQYLTNLVTNLAAEMGKNGVLLSVEGIQDLVEVTLMKNNFHDVARDYIIYRDQHTEARKTHPSNIKIIRKDGQTKVRFNPMKITQTIENAFRRVQTDTNMPQEIIERVNELTQKMIETVIDLHKEGKSIDLFQIADLIEELLMKEGHFKEAKFYILHRKQVEDREEESTHKSARKLKKQSGSKERSFTVISEDGSKQVITESEIKQRITFACRGYEADVSPEQLFELTLMNFYEGIKESEIDTALIMAARSLVERDPAYSFITSRLLLDKLYREAMEISALDPGVELAHRQYFISYIKKGIFYELLSPELLNFDLDKLAGALVLQRDDLFQYLGLQTLYDRYFIHQNQRRLETPQIFWMRVAMGLALKEEKKNERAIEFYNLISEHYYCTATPTLFNSGTTHSQLSSCFLSTVYDDLGHIFKVISDDAQLSKWAGGLGNDWTNVRATGSRIKGTNGQSQGVIPFLKVANDTAVAVNQCFDPDTRIFTQEGIKTIADVVIGDLVLGVSGTYREVTDKFVYNQKDPMCSIDIKHSIEPVRVTTAHPFYAIQGVPLEQANHRTYKALSKGTISAAWTEANKLKVGDFVAQVIPKEIIPAAGFTEEDARLYGMLLGDGHCSKNGLEWGISFNPQTDTHVAFVKEYLTSREIHFWETGRGSTYLQIRWAAGRGVLQEATTGRFCSAGQAVLPFDYEDLYDENKCKRIAPRLSHLPLNQTIAMLQGLIETDGNVSRGKEITFTNTSLNLVEGVRYQCLRLGVPTAGNKRVRNHDHEATRSDGSKVVFNGETTSYDLRIPAFAELAEKVDCKPLTKHNWLTAGGFVWSRITAIHEVEETAAVCDLLVDGDESYMTVAGLAHNGGKRKGALCSYLETWHLDIEDFLELRKNTGDERRRTHDMNTANWIPDLFMRRVEEGKHWTLFSPSDTPDLHDLYGKAFEKRYEEYEAMAEGGKIPLHKKVDATTLWRKMISMLFETGHPWITFKDPSNIRSPQDHAGVVHSSNLCTEILLNTSKDEVAVCNLGSVNLARHLTADGKVDQKRIEETVKTAVRMLDNVIDINFYPIKETENANQRHRPIGLGIMGFQDVLYMKKVSYASHEAVVLADEIMEMISYYAIKTSSELAKEKGAYSSYKGSKWDRGLLPIDTIDLLEKERGLPVDMDRSAKMDWTPIREMVKKYGMRNSNTMAIAPTATIANIIGVTASIEPSYKNLFVKSNLSGEFTVPNSFLINELKKDGLWDEEMLDDLKYYDGSLMEIARVPDELKGLFLTSFDIDPLWIIECGSRRQKWIDMGQSLNLYVATASGKKLHEMYMQAWKKGIKTLYYLRTLGATQVEKSTTDVNKRGLQPRWMKNQSASSNIQVQREPSTTSPKACPLDGSCESCQ